MIGGIRVLEAEPWCKQSDVGLSPRGGKENKKQKQNRDTDQKT
jgi:hypothetical protein